MPIGEGPWNMCGYYRADNQDIEILQQSVVKFFVSNRLQGGADFKTTNRQQAANDFKTTNHPQLADDFNLDKSSATCGKIIS